MSRESMGFRLGEPVKWCESAELHRQNEGGRRVWVTWDYGWLRSRKREGFIIGARTLRNGTVDHDYESGSTFTGDESIPALVVVYDMREKPVYISPLAAELNR